MPVCICTQFLIYIVFCIILFFIKVPFHYYPYINCLILLINCLFLLTDEAQADDHGPAGNCQEGEANVLEGRGRSVYRQQNAQAFVLRKTRQRQDGPTLSVFVCSSTLLGFGLLIAHAFAWIPICL